ncbi:MAG: hypothetical protein Q7S20_09590 [Gemmatimonadaceae bacterium]|nr:hypothetical protein [Gemmatimonadaceae bacterium]
MHQRAIAAAAALISTYNVYQSNGVIHVVDKALLPNFRRCSPRQARRWVSSLSSSTCRIFPGVTQFRDLFSGGAALYSRYRPHYPVAPVKPALARHWGDPDVRHLVQWPLHIRAGYV